MGDVQPLLTVTRPGLSPAASASAPAPVPPAERRSLPAPVGGLRDERSADTPASGVWSDDGELAYGVAGGDASAVLPPGLSHLVGGVSVLALLLGPLVGVPLMLVALGLLWTRWRRRSALDICALGALAAAVALVVLLAHWGDELWVWILD